MNKKLLLISVLALIFLTACGNTKTTSKGSSDAQQSKDAEIINNLDELNEQDASEERGLYAQESNDDTNSPSLQGEKRGTSTGETTQENSSGNPSDDNRTNQTTPTDNSSNKPTDNTQATKPSQDSEENQGETNNSTVPTKVPGTPEVTIEPEVKPTKVPSPTKSPVITPTKTPNPTKVPTSTVAPTKTPVPTKVPTPTRIPTVTQAPTKTPTPTKVPSTTPPVTVGQKDSISMRGETISIGDSKNSVIQAFGSPDRTDTTEYSYDFMVYNDNYKKFMMVAIEDGKVVGWYTDSVDFLYQGLTTSSNVSSINSVLGKSTSLKRTISVTDGGNKITFFMDTLGDSTIDGIAVFDDGISKGSTTTSVLKAWEKEVLDLTNSFRVRNGLDALSWSDAAAKSARLHSEDMAESNYFSHTGLNGSTPGDRMKAQGIQYRSNGENIIGGYGNALFSSNGWMNSSGHRTNMLNKSFTYLGVGYALGGSYGNYATQNFYSK